MNEVKRSPFSICDGKYMIYYKTPISARNDISYYDIGKFIGVCENFCPSGTSVFWNEDKEQMLIVQYSDIVQMKPIE